jgi:hypothetical protein
MKRKFHEINTMAIFAYVMFNHVLVSC